MKTWHASLMGLLFTSLFFFDFCSPAFSEDNEVNIGFFYDQLAPYGTWIENSEYGWVWFPNGTPVDWRPYSVGQWVLTDDYGWTWESAWEWGWAPFHYGRWFLDETYGWSWIPGYDWAPAWVAWRSGGGFIGWAPLPPQVRWEPVRGLVFGEFNIDRDLALPSWVFVKDRFLTEPHLNRYVVMAPRNATLINGTKSITGITVANGRIVNRSVEAAVIEKAAGRPIPRLHVASVDSIAQLHLAYDRNDEIKIFRPVIKTEPPDRKPTLPMDMAARQALERMELEQRQATEASRLEQQHRMENDRAASAAEKATGETNPEEIKRRHEAERQALQTEQERQRRLLENRHRQEMEEQGTEENPPEKKERHERG